MLDTKHIIGAVAVLLSVALLGSLALAWPSYRQVWLIDREIADLRVRIDMAGASTAQVALLEAKLSEAERKVSEELKVIADSPDLADLMRRLSLHVDHETVIDQTFTAGSPFVVALRALADDSTDAAPGKAGGSGDSGGEGRRPMAVPVTIDLVGTFESLFAILTAAESMERLIRVTTLRVTCERSEKNNNRQQPVLNAQVGLEAVYAESAYRR